MAPRSSLFSLLAAVTAVGCGGGTDTAASMSARDAVGAASAEAPGVVYTLSNDPAANAVLAFARAADGTLTPAGAFPTGGAGLGAGLGSQGALTFSHDGRWLLAVNAGSDDVSLFSVAGSGALDLVDRAPSGGVRPISVTVAGELVFVLNAGVPNSVTGLRIGAGGQLQPMPGATRPLSVADAGPAEVALDQRGRFVVVTEKATSRLDVYAVDASGGIEGPQVVPSSGAVPFGFAFTREGLLVVSEAAGSTVSSYRLADGGLGTVTASLPDLQGAACWIAITTDGRFAYAANTGADNLSGFAIGPDGSLALLDASGVTAPAGDAPADLALSRGSRYLYARNGGDGSISGYRVQGDGALEPVTTVGGLPAAASGLAAR